MSDDKTMERVRALLTQAEHPNTSTEEAEAFTAKAAALMAKYGIDRALLADREPGSDAPDNRIVEVPNPWGDEKATLLYNLATAMRCQAIHLGKQTGGKRTHVFGYRSDLDRVDVLYTSLLLQMASGLAQAEVPDYDTPRRYRRSWMLGFISEVVGRVKAAEDRATAESEAARQQAGESGRGTALVLLDRKQVVEQQLAGQYPRVRVSRTSWTGTGYRAGRAAGQRADVGSTRVGSAGRRGIGGAR